MNNDLDGFPRQFTAAGARVTGGIAFAGSSNGIIQSLRGKLCDGTASTEDYKERVEKK